MRTRPNRPGHGEPVALLDPTSSRRSTVLFIGYRVALGGLLIALLSGTVITAT